MESIVEFHQHLKNTWNEFVKNKTISKGEVRDVILQSWQNCVRQGVDPFQKKVPRVLADHDLRKRLSANQLLIDVSLPVMENLYQFVAGSGFSITLFDKDGIILKTFGDEDITMSFARGNYVVGADWSESSAGTNAACLSLIHGNPIQTTYYEHFCICCHPSTCSSSPLQDPEGRVIGALNMTGTYEKAHSHTLGMVVAAGQGIEKQLESRQAWERCHIADSYKTAIMEAISEGILATDEYGRINHTNQYAEEILESTSEKIIGQKVSKFLKPSHSLFDDFDLSNSVTDKEADILGQEKNKKGIVTIRPIGNPDSQQKGNVILLNKISRTKRLVQQMIGAKSKRTFGDILGQQENFLSTVRLAQTAASGFSNILLLGESGTGKDVFAQAIHNSSQHNDGPFVAINTGAIPRELISSELFGYADGAFTGAKRGGNPGKFELADGGTLFLDEIGEMPLELQTVLLRVVEQKSVVRVGGKEEIAVNVRLIAATHKNLIEEVEKGNFRRDLYYRLNVITISLLALRDHKDDIPLLANHFIDKMNKILGKEITKLEPEVWDMLTRYNWPGNVRELYNVLERAMNVNDSNTLTTKSLPLEFSPHAKTTSSHGSYNEMEREMIIKILSEFSGNISSAASKLGIARTTLYRKIKKYNL
ncbi:sigma 54-interacting transcriptional regulator [bacterium]|nr:sigma 54-interacting transcriptional regulator [bacterium]